MPLDDYHCWNFSISWNPYRPFTEEEVKEHWSGHGLHALTDHKYRPLSNSSNDYNIDREEQRYRTFTGIKGIGEQDMGTQESMGALTWRAGEHLGSSDSAIIAYRRRLLTECRNLQEGVESLRRHAPGVLQGALRLSARQPRRGLPRGRRRPAGRSDLGTSDTTVPPVRPEPVEERASGTCVL